MTAIEWLFELALAGLLAATLIRAVRLERALGVLRRDGPSLQRMADDFNAGARRAEASVARLQEAAEGAGRRLGAQSDAASTLKDDLALLTERGDQLADRLEALVGAARPLAAEAARPRAPADRTRDRTPAEGAPAKRTAARAARPRA